VAAKQFGATVGGFTKSYQNVLKKMRENNWYIGAGDDDGETAVASSNGPVTPTKNSVSPRKRNATEEGAAGSAKKRRTPKKKVEVKAEEDDEEDACIGAGASSQETEV
jgi:hypothetical protein